MVLEEYMEFKGLHSEKKLFSRGLVITESEMENFFAMPPNYRERDINDPVLTEDVKEAFDHIEERSRATSEEVLKIRSVRDTFGLGRTELFALILGLAVRVDRNYERIYGFLQDDITKTQPTVGLLYALLSRFTAREWDSPFFPQPLDRKMFIYFFTPEKEKDGLGAPLLLNPLMESFLRGTEEVKKFSSVPFKLYEEDDAPMFFEADALKIAKAMEVGNKLCYLAGNDQDTLLHILFKLSGEGGKKLYVLDMPKLMVLSESYRERAISELLLRLRLYKGLLCVRQTSEIGAREQWEILEYISSIHEGCIFLFGEKEEPGELAVESVPVISISFPEVESRIGIWNFFINKECDEKGISISSDIIIPDLADCYEVSYGVIKKACHNAASASIMDGRNALDREKLLSCLWQLHNVNFSGLATPIKAPYTWEDISIVQKEKEVLKAACDRYRLRNRLGNKWGLKKKNAYGNGVSVLIYGPPGTGKTMAALVVARELSLPLYRVDLSQIFSKYIGETEKNLSLIFDAAADSNVILFFDEADALFSKRTEIQGSNDKYSNSETAYLLQKIEEYDGMSILATNYYQNFDPAFVRRITYSVYMEKPDEERRFNLWKGILPDESELEDDIDFHFLAREFELSGSNIKAILFSAAYMAGAEGSKIGARHIVKAMEREFRKMGQLIDIGQFGKYAMYL